MVLRVSCFSVVIMSFIFWEGHPSPSLSVGTVSGLGAHVNMDLWGGPLLQAKPTAFCQRLSHVLPFSSTMEERGEDRQETKTIQEYLC